MAATFEKANTYVFAAPIIRDREVGGSNPLAPTIKINDLRLPAYFICGQFVDKKFDSRNLALLDRHHLQKTAQKRES
jgi:hypothetical protein